MNYGRHRIVKELGKGAMGVVYQAHDPQIDRLVALKVLRPDRVTTEAFLQRFMKEAKAIGRLSHPNMVIVYDVGEDHGTVYIAMEFLKGKDLVDACKDGQLLPVPRVLSIVARVAEALAYAHKQNVVHRDIKPANIKLTPDGLIKRISRSDTQLWVTLRHTDTRPCAALRVSGERSEISIVKSLILPSSIIDPPIPEKDCE